MLGCLIFPANSLTIYRFYKQKLNKTFFLLAATLCVNNFFMGLLAFLIGAAKFSPNHPLGQIGCVLVVGSLGAITNCTLLIQALISYERRRAIVAKNFIQINTRIYAFLVLAFIIPYGFWFAFESVLGGAKTFNVQVNSHSTETILICNPADVPFIGGNEILFTMLSFVIPAILIVYNYW